MFKANRYHIYLHYKDMANDQTLRFRARQQRSTRVIRISGLFLVDVTDALTTISSKGNNISSAIRGLW